MRSRVLTLEIHEAEDGVAGLIVTLPEKNQATGGDCKQLLTLQVKSESAREKSGYN